MEFSSYIDAITVAVVWMVREIVVTVWKHRDGYSISDKINYLFKREKARENVEDYMSKHPHLEDRDD